MKSPSRTDPWALILGGSSRAKAALAVPDTGVLVSVLFSRNQQLHAQVSQFELTVSIGRRMKWLRVLLSAEKEAAKVVKGNGIVEGGRYKTRRWLVKTCLGVLPNGC